MMHWWNPGGYGYGMGYGGLWAILPTLFWLLVIVGGFFFLRSYLTNNQTRAGNQGSALELLRERYARGEISKDEYLQIKKDLED